MKVLLKKFGQVCFLARLVEADAYLQYENNSPSLVWFLNVVLITVVWIAAADVYAAGDVCTASWPYATHWMQMRLWTQVTLYRQGFTMRSLTDVARTV